MCSKINGYAYNLLLGLWNEVFLGCNLCLFILLPFAYFFTESAGFSGSRKVISLSLSPPSHPQISLSLLFHPLCFNCVHTGSNVQSIRDYSSAEHAGYHGNGAGWTPLLHILTWKHWGTCTCTCMFHAIKYLFIPIQTDVTINIMLARLLVSPIICYFSHREYNRVPNSEFMLLYKHPLHHCSKQ